MGFKESFSLKDNELNEKRVFRDAIHDYIHVDHLIIWRLINSQEVQRLRRVKQLGGTYQVFQSAEHSRFVHSLGVYQVVRRMLETEALTNTLNDYDKLCVMCAGLLHDIGKSVDHEMEGSHISIGVDLCRKYKESAIVINAVESHHGDVEPETLIACIVQAADTISAARPGARRETLETYTNRLKQLEDIANEFKGVDKSFAIQAGREIRIMVVPEQINDDDMVLLARDISKKIEDELEYPGQIKVNVIRESRVTDYAK